MQEVVGGVSDGQGRRAPRLCAVMLERECQGNGEQWVGLARLCLLARRPVDVVLQCSIDYGLVTDQWYTNLVIYQ